MPSSRWLEALALLLLGCSAAPAQEPPAPATPSSTAPSKSAPPVPAVAAPDPARTLLERAARFQRGDVPRGPPASFHGRFYVGVRDPDGNLIQAEVERWYTRAPERLLTTRTEAVTGSRSSVGWDGRMAWFRDERSGQVVIYSDAPEIHAVDLDLMQEQLRLTRLLLDAAVLDALLPRLEHLSLGEPTTWVDIDEVEHAAAVVSAEIPDEVFGPPPGAPPPLPGEPPPPLALRFVIDSETGALWSLRVEAPHRPDQPALRLHFDLHGMTRTGLRVAGNVRVFRGDETREQVTLGVETVDLDGEERLLFDLDEPVDATLFAAPPRKN